MKKYFFTLFTFIITSTFSLQAQQVYDTINETMVGPGTKLIEINELTKPLAIQVLEIDLNNPYLRIESAKANDNINSLEKTSSMAKRKSTEGHQVIGAINGDFFYSGGKSVNAQVAGGELIRTPIPRSTISFTTSNEPLIQILDFSGKVFAKGNEHSLNNVNNVRSVNNFILYNPYMGDNTQTNPYGNEIVCVPVSDWVINDTVWLKASEIFIGSGSTPIPDGAVVLSGHGTAATFVEDYIAVGDTFGIMINMGDETKVLKTMVGGYPQIVKDGENYADQGYINEGGPDHTYDRHPRTAVGYSQDTTKLYLITVDGRQSHSIGMTLPELADFMVLINCYHGINFDGGGSTTMVANHEIVNSPSDYNGERSVSNALMVVSSAPQGSLNKIRIQPSEIDIRFGYYKALKVAAYDEYDNLISIDTADLSYAVTENIGTVANHTFYAYNETGTGYLKVCYGSLTDSILVTIHPIESFTLTPKEIMTDSIIPVEFAALATNIDTREFEIPKNLVSWSVENTNLGTITEEGVFKGLQEGSTKVYAQIGEASAEATVNIEIYSENLLLDAMESAESWEIISSGIDSISVTNTLSNTQGDGCIRIFYQFKYRSITPYFKMIKKIPVPGIPDSLWIDKRFSGNQHRLTFNLSHQSSTFNLSYGSLEANTEFVKEGFGLKTLNLEDYPYAIEDLKIEIWKNTEWQTDQIITGTILLDNLRASYPYHSPIENPVSILQYAEKNSVTIYPNPGTGNFTIKNLDLSSGTIADIVVFDINGRMVSSTLGYAKNNSLQFDISALNPGLYFITITTESKKFHSKIIKK